SDVCYSDVCSVFVSGRLFFFSSRRRHTRSKRDWSSDVCSSDLISWMIEGKVDWETFTFDMHTIQKMDGGFDFYAPQTALISSQPNEYLAIAWQQAWNRTLTSHDLN